MTRDSRGEAWHGIPWETSRRSLQATVLGDVHVRQCSTYAQQSILWVFEFHIVRGEVYGAR